MDFKNIKIKGFEHYRIYDNGDVYNEKRGNFITGDYNSCGYKRVTLYNNKTSLKFFRHRLVAEYFVDGYVRQKQVNHIDGNKENNSKNNLEWVTQSENEQHKQRFLNPKKTVKRVKAVINSEEYIFESQKDFCKFFKCSQLSASNWLLGKTFPTKIKFDELKYI